VGAGAVPQVWQQPHRAVCTLQQLHLGSLQHLLAGAEASNLSNLQISRMAAVAKAPAPAALVRSHSGPAATPPASLCSSSNSQAELRSRRSQSRSKSSSQSRSKSSSRSSSWSSTFSSSRSSSQVVRPAPARPEPGPPASAPPAAGWLTTPSEAEVRAAFDQHGIQQRRHEPRHDPHHDPSKSRSG